MAPQPLKTVQVRFYEELNDYLPPGHRKEDLTVALKAQGTVRSVVTALGVPPAKIDLVLVNGGSAAWDTVLAPGDRISVYPVFERLNIEAVTQLRCRPLRRLRFLTDDGLTELARAMRGAGWDTVCRSGDSVLEICRRCIQEKRILLTRRKSRFVEAGITHVIPVGSGPAAAQLRGVLETLDIDINAE